MTTTSILFTTSSRPNVVSFVRRTLEKNYIQQPRLLSTFDVVLQRRQDYYPYNDVQSTRSLSSSSMGVSSPISFVTPPKTSNNRSTDGSLSQARYYRTIPLCLSSAANAAASTPVASVVASPTGAYDQTVSEFPSLIIKGGTNDDDAITAVGSFAEAQAMYLNPDPDAVNELVQLLQRTNSGIVAHYYMDVELQGVLQAVNNALPGRVGIADSLKMGDMAVEMVQQHAVTSILCLGVDFMSESVAAILNQNGYGNIPVYRATTKKIGCSLAESAERDTYRAWLQNESSNNTSALHVVYINTSLETKAISNSIVPTITCTSSNVLQTLLQAAIEVPNARILYGPDTYMGENLQTLLSTILNNKDWDNERIAKQLHPKHTRTTLEQLYNNLVVYPSGNCIVHHMFGEAVVNTVRTKYYNDCYVTAHLEVPGEMFQIAMEKSLLDHGVVGSTADILNFITRKVQEATTTTPPTGTTSSSTNQRLKFILGTEAGMVTSIVRNVQRILTEHTKKGSIEVEIIFPVAAEAVHSTDDGNLVPGVSGGEGCSTAGGCATCPYMKMNSLDTVVDVLELIGGTKQQNMLLKKHLPPNKLQGAVINGRDAITMGTEPIGYMRYFTANKTLSPNLVQRVIQSSKSS